MEGIRGRQAGGPGHDRDGPGRGLIMSVEAMAWVLNEADLVDATEAMVLIGIANHAGHDGTGARAGQAILAKYARCSDRTVRRKLLDLEARGVIRRGDPAPARHIPANVRPVVWDLVMDGQRVRTPEAGQNVRTDTQSAEDGHTVQIARHRMLEKPEELNTPPVSLFDAFYRSYPRHEHRREAAKAWERAIKRADPIDIIDGARRFSVDPNRVDRFTAHPATWLNADGWLDDPLPAREVRDRQGDILAQEFARARSVDAAEQQQMLALEK